MIDLKTLFKDFNHSKFLVFICLLPCAILISLKLDQHINWSLWLVFTPLWLLKLVVILGAFIGSIEWCRHPGYRHDAESYTDFKAMLMTLGMQLLLLMFELLVCNKVENNGQNSWIFVFMPLYFVSPVAVAACIWGFKHDRSLELEALLSINILLFIFVALKLDDTIDWSWTVIFIPLWIAMCFPGVAVLYYLVWTLLFFRSSSPGVDRRAHLSDAIIWIAVVIPILTFQVLLSYKLDGLNQYPWVNIFIPLFISLLALICSSFGRKGGNNWWFGLREDFCIFLLESCPFMRIYGNISYKIPKEKDASNQEELAQADNRNSWVTDVRYYAASDFRFSTKVITSSPAGCSTVLPPAYIESPD